MDDPERESRFHAGEIAFHRALGIEEKMQGFGQRVIRDFMPDDHRELFAKLPYVVVGALDARDRPWASIAFGAPGFVQSPDARTLVLRAPALPGDPVRAAMRVSARIGLLGIELSTRRRNRMNGVVVAADEDHVVVAVEQSFGNCPKYIVPRTPTSVDDGARDPNARARPISARLDARAAAIVDRADTFFIATASSDARRGGHGEGVDVSHRGGLRGFVGRTDEGGHSVLAVRDLVGNFFFNTLGNLAVNPGAGLLFVDFDEGDLLMLSGTAEVVVDATEVVEPPATSRVVRFRVDEGLLFESAFPFAWSTPD